MTHNDETEELQPLDITYSNPITAAAWKILHEAQKEHFLLDIASQLAEFDGYNFPETPEEVLWWFLDEAKVQEEQADADIDTEDTIERALGTTVMYQTSTHLRRYAIELLQLGLQPVPPTKRGENHDMEYIP